MSNVALLTRDGAPNVALLVRPVSAVAPTITTTALPNGQIGVAYSQTIQRTGSAPSFSVTAGSLPSGLSLNTISGVISGTPTSPSASSFTVTATNSAGSDAKALSITVPNEFVTQSAAPAVVTVTLAEGEAVNQSATQELTATVMDEDGPVVNIAGSVASADGGVATVQLLGPTDAEGKASVLVTGVASGTTTLTATFDGVSSNAVAQTVNEVQAPSFGEIAPPGATIGTEYSFQVDATGNPVPTFAVTVGSLPPGLSMSADGLITGTPTGDTSQTYNFTVTATNSAGSAALATSIAVSSVAVPPTITTVTLPAMTLNASVSAAFNATGTAPILWSVGIGSLPPGLTLNQSTGALTGTPTLNGPFTFTVVATNSAGVDSRQFSVAVALPAGARLRITSVHPKALTATDLSGTVFAPAGPGRKVGERIGEFSGKVFEPYEGGAAMTVLLSEFGGMGLAVGDRPKVYIEGITAATHVFEAEVVAS